MFSSHNRFGKVVLVVAALSISLTGCSTISDAFDQASSEIQDEAKKELKKIEKQAKKKSKELQKEINKGTKELQNNVEPKNTATVDSPAGETLAKIPVKGRAPKTGYTRDEYGSAWAKDLNDNGCDTRNDILQRDLTNIVFQDGSDCIVATGTLKDPYGGEIINFVRGPDSAAVQIDHVVALSDSWQKGAQQWSDEKREYFANDPLNLIAADGPLNMSKSDGDAATWLPPNKKYRCKYVANQVAVKAKYGLWMTQAEKDAINSILADCPNEKLPSSDVVPPSK